MVKHAVVSDGYLVMIDEAQRKLRRVPFSFPYHVTDLWAVGQRMDITHFWIMPGSVVDAFGWAFLEKREGYKIFIPGEVDKDTPPRAASCKKGHAVGAFEINVAWPANGNGFAWICNHPLDILASVDYLTQVLGIGDIKYSSQHIGKLYLQDKYKATKRMQSYIRKPDTDLSKLPFRKAAQEIYFTRPLDASMVGSWYHLYDKNSAHPAAASSVVTGCGDPVHLTSDIAAKWPGIYRVTCTANTSQFNDVDLPKVITSDWITLDVLKFALKNGHTVDIHEAYVFEQHRNIFGDWARDLWQARQRLKDENAFVYGPGRENAYYTVKQIMNTTISAQKDNVNWWADMVGMARVARLANITKFTEHAQLTLVYVDDMAFISPDENPAAAIPGILDRTDKLGGYKHKYSLQITEQMVQDCPVAKGDRPANEAGRLLAFFKKCAREKGLIDE